MFIVILIIIRLGLSLTMEESLEDVQVCGNRDAPMSRRLNAIRWSLLFIFVMVGHQHQHQATVGGGGEYKGDV